VSDAAGASGADGTKKKELPTTNGKVNGILECAGE
jgi:hypothetical protein